MAALNRTFINAANVDPVTKLIANAVADALDAGVVGGVAVTATVAEVNALTTQLASITMATTPATGTCAVQFTFKDAQGVALTHAVSGQAYVSASTGLSTVTVTSVATLTNGEVDTVVTGKLFNYITTAAGLLGLTLTMTTGSYYVTFELPNGRLATTTAIVVN